MMSSIDSTAPDPSVACNIPMLPFVRLPDPGQLLLARAARFATLAEGHELAPYLRFLSSLCQVQAAIQEGLPEPDAIAAVASIRF